MPLTIPCEFELDSYVYRCKISHQEIPEDETISTFIGEHVIKNRIVKKTEADVRVVHFQNCVIPRLPQGLGLHFEKVTALYMNKCQLQVIEKFDLRGLGNLNHLDLSDNEIEHLPGNLFFFTKKVRKISFANNKINSIGPQLLDNFNGRECIFHFDFSGNPGIDLKKREHQSFEDFKKLFKEKCEEMQKTVNDSLEVKIGALETENIEVKAENIELKAEIAQLKSREVIGNLSQDLNALIKDENAKDFLIIVGDEEFMVHKFLLAARSKVFKEMFENNPEAQNLELEDISVEVVKAVLDFIYTDKPPSVEIDVLKVLNVASKLEIAKLQEISAEKLAEKLKT